PPARQMQISSSVSGGSFRVVMGSASRAISDMAQSLVIALGGDVSRPVPPARPAGDRGDDPLVVIGIVVSGRELLLFAAVLALKQRGKVTAKNPDVFANPHSPPPPSPSPGRRGQRRIAAHAGRSRQDRPCQGRATRTRSQTDPGTKLRL